MNAIQVIFEANFLQRSKCDEYQLHKDQCSFLEKSEIK